MHAISNSAETIASRDIVTRIEELEDVDDRSAIEDAELAELRALAQEVSGYSREWPDHATLIRDSYFPTYAMEYAEGIGAIGSNPEWPMNCIDWVAAGLDLQADYTAIEFGDAIYWVRD